MTDHEIEAAADALLAHPVAYHPAFAIIMESGNGGIVLSQLVFQARRFGWDEFWHKDSQIVEETGLSLKQVRAAKNKLQGMPFVEVRIADMPAKTYYRIDRLNLFKFMATANQNAVFSRISQYAQKGQTRMPKRAKLECPKGPDIETVLETEETSSPGATVKKPNSGKFQRLYIAKWESHYGQKHPFTGADAKKIQSIWVMLKGDVRQFKKVLDVFFNAKWPSGHTTGVFLSQMAQWVAPPPANANGNGHPTTPAKIISVSRRVERINFDN